MSMFFKKFKVDELTEICKEFHNRIYKLNEEKWDLELITCVKEYEVCMIL